MATLESAPIAGSRAGRYLFMRQQTSSYVGSLWEVRCEAEQQLLALARVVKVPNGIDTETEQNLSQAAWDSMELDDENIVRVADVVFGTGWFAMVHDHYDGDTVRTMQRRVAERKSAVPVPVAIRIVLDTLEALRKVNEAIEELGVTVSPAIDPGSLLVCEDGRTRLLDGFVGGYVPNVPKMARDDETFAYAAPESFDNPAATDECTQVFRVAIIAWELLCSKRLLVGSKAVIQRRLTSPIVRADRVTRVGVSASERLGLVIEKALKLERSQRYQTLAEFEKAVRDAVDAVGTQEEVIQFSDALVGRESTLARLVMDKPQRLSDAMKSIRPTADVTKSFAQRVMGGSAPAAQGAQSKKDASTTGTKTPYKAPSIAAKAVPNSSAKVTGKTLPLGVAPDALFSAPARAARVERQERAYVPVPAAKAAPAPVAPTPVAVAAPMPAAIAARGSRLDSPAATRRGAAEVAARAGTPAPMTAAPVARVAAPPLNAVNVPSGVAAAEAPPPPRQRLKTLVGLFPEDFAPGGTAAEASAAEIPDDSSNIATSAVMETATPTSHVAPLDHVTHDDNWPEDEGDGDTDKIDVEDLAEDDSDDDGDEMDVGEVDELDDVPTQAYNVAQFAAVAREARARLESGPRLASKPPPAEDPFAPAQAARSPWQAPAPQPLAPAESAGTATRPAPEEAYEHEATMPAAQAVPLATHIQSALAHTPASGPSPAVGAPPLAAAQPTPAPAQAVAAPAQPVAAPAKPERRLLMLTMFFAGTTFALAIVALGLLVRSESAEQTASALAGAPVAPAQPSPNVNGTVPAAAPPAIAPTAAAPAAAQAEPPVDAAEATPPPEPEAPEPAPAEATEPAAEAAAPEATEPTPNPAPTAAQPTPAPAPRAVRRAAPRKSKVSSPRYVPSDI